MSNKLKAKPKKQRIPLARSNQSAQEFGRAMNNCRNQIKEMEEKAYADGFNTGEDWSNTINTVTMVMALREKYGWGTKRLLDIVHLANSYVKKANDGERTVMSMIEEIEEKTEFRFDSYNKDLVRRMGV